MPYVDPEVRGPAEFVPETAGELNYALTKVIQGYMLRTGLSYTIINDVIGALEGAKLEFYRRVAVPYENKKIAENGDVYPEELTR